MAIDKQQVKELLGNGLPVSVVASAVGCTDSYITQLLADEEFSAEVARLRVVALQANNQRDGSINGIEDTLISKLKEGVESGFFYKPRDLLHAFAVVNSAKRRGTVNADSATLQNTTVINLTIPAAVARRFTIDSRGEVLQVDEQTLVTMPTGQLLSSVGSRTGREEKYREIKNRLMHDVRDRGDENVS